jgi:hypothetical protein
LLLQLHDLTRISSSQQLLNAVVYDSMQPAASAWPHMQQAPPGSTGMVSQPETEEGSSRTSSYKKHVSTCSPVAAATVCSSSLPGNNNSSSEQQCATAAADTGQQPGNQAPAVARCSSNVAPGVLQFDSQFEGGNLRMAVHVWGNEYDLFMSNDLNDRWVEPPCSNSGCSIIHLNAVVLSGHRVGATMGALRVR